MMSATMLKMMVKVAVTITKASRRFGSGDGFDNESRKKSPMPFQAKTRSVITAPAISPPQLSVATVAIGMSALRKAWRTITRVSEMPFARAVRTWSAFSCSSMEARMKRL